MTDQKTLSSQDLALVLGCEVTYRGNRDHYTLHSIDTYGTGYILQEGLFHIIHEAKDIKPILRPPLDTTKEENKYMKEHKIILIGGKSEGYHFAGPPKHLIWMIRQGLDVFNWHKDKLCLYKEDLK